MENVIVTNHLDTPMTEKQYTSICILEDETRRVIPHAKFLAEYVQGANHRFVRFITIWSRTAGGSQQFDEVVTRVQLISPSGTIMNTYQSTVLVPA